MGDLHYLADNERPDLAFITENVASAMQFPTARHWEALKMTIRYRIHTPNKGIYFRMGQT